MKIARIKIHGVGEREVYFSDDVFEFLNENDVSQNSQWYYTSIARTLSERAYYLPLLIEKIEYVDSNDKKHPGAYRLTCMDVAGIEVGFEILVDLNTCTDLDIENTHSTKDKKALSVEVTDGFAISQLNLNYSANQNKKKLMDEKIQKIREKKAKQDAEFKAGKIDLKFYPPSPPHTYKSQYQDVDYTFERLTETFPQLESVYTYSQMASSNVKALDEIDAEIKKEFNALQPYKDASDEEKDFFLREQDRIRKELFESVSAEIQYEKLKSQMTEDSSRMATAIAHIEEPIQNNSIGKSWAGSVTAEERLNDLKKYLAYSIYIAAGEYYQTELMADKKNRVKNINQFNKIFKDYVQIEKGSLSSIEVIYENLSSKSLKKIQEDINKILSASDTEFFSSSSTLTHLVKEMQSIAKMLTIEEQPFGVTDKQKDADSVLPRYIPAKFTWQESTVAKETTVSATRDAITERLTHCKEGSVIKDDKDRDVTLDTVYSNIKTRHNNLALMQDQLQRFKAYMEGYKVLFQHQNDVLKKIHELKLEQTQATMLDNLQTAENDFKATSEIANGLSQANKNKYDGIVSQHRIEKTELQDQINSLMQNLQEARKKLIEFKLSPIQPSKSDSGKMLQLYSEFLQAEKAFVELKNKIENLKKKANAAKLNASLDADQVALKVLQTTIKTMVEHVNANDVTDNIAHSRKNENEMQKLIRSYENARRIINGMNQKYNGSRPATKYKQADKKKLQVAYAKFIDLGPQIQARSEKLEKLDQLKSAHESAQETLEQFRRSILRHYRNFYGKDFSLQNSGFNPTVQGMILKLRDIYLENLGNHTDLLKQFNDNPEENLKNIDTFLSQREEYFENIKLSFHALRDLEYFIYFQDEFKKIQQEIPKFNYPTAVSDYPSDETLPQLIKVYQERKEQLEKYLKENIVEIKDDLLVDGRLDDKVYESIYRLDSSKNKIYDALASFHEAQKAVDARIESNELKKYSETTIHHLKTIETALAPKLLESSYHSRAIPLRDEISRSRTDLLNQAKRYQEVDFIPNAASELENFLTAFHVVKDQLQAGVNIVSPPADINPSTKSELNNRKAVRELYILISNSIHMLEAKKDELKRKNVDGMDERYTFTVRALSELNELKANIEDKLFVETQPSFGNLRENIYKALLKYENDKMESVRNLASKKEELNQAAKSYKNNKSDATKQILEQKRSEYKVLMKSENEKNINNRKMLDESKLAYNSAIKNVKVKAKVSKADISIRLDSYQYTVTKFHHQMQEYLVAKKEETKGVSRLRFWLGRFKERFVDGVKRFFSHHNEINPYDHLSTVGTARNMLQGAKARFGLFARKFQIEPNIPIVIAPNIKEMDLTKTERVQAIQHKQHILVMEQIVKPKSVSEISESEVSEPVNKITTSRSDHEFKEFDAALLDMESLLNELQDSESGELKKQEQDSEFPAEPSKVSGFGMGTRE